MTRKFQSTVSISFIIGIVIFCSSCQMTSQKPDTKISEPQAKVIAFQAVIDEHKEKVGYDGGEIVEILDDSASPDAYVKYSSSLISNVWNIVLPIQVKTNKSIYITSYQLKIDSEDGHIIEFAKAAGYLILKDLSS